MNAPRQLLLNIRPAESAAFANFIAGANGELLARLAGLTDAGNFDQIYLWGPPGSGRSHLLQATLARAEEARRPVLALNARQLGDELIPPAGGLIIIDDVDALSDAAQITVFRTFNAARLVGLALLLSGPQPPLLLKLREDLRTRIGAALVYEVKALSDGDKAEALKRHARDRGMPMDAALIEYLLRHGRRDLPSLLAMLDRLDRVSLEQQRLPTLPLLRVLMHDSLESTDATPGPRPV